MVVVPLNGGEFGSLACTRAALQAAVTVPLRLLIPPLTLGWVCRIAVGTILSIRSPRTLAPLAVAAASRGTGPLPAAAGGPGERRGWRRRGFPAHPPACPGPEAYAPAVSLSRFSLTSGSVGPRPRACVHACGPGGAGSLAGRLGGRARVTVRARACRRQRGGRPGRHRG
jgi:hypothetical protein